MACRSARLASTVALLFSTTHEEAHVDIDRGQRQRSIDAPSIEQMASTAFNFGAEFIDCNDADSLAPRRTARRRVIQLSLKLGM